LKQIILGTAGHIDHGKTSLIKALTGVNTDRLKEEKERGITIELGFAAMTLPGGWHLGIVDVPGHEKFVKNMVAGATGIDIVAMVIAADEGVMPQTREHMEICTLLDIRHGLVALTKTDLVDEEWLELVIDDVETFVAGTFLENRPIVPVSSHTGDGVQTLVRELDTLCEQVPDRHPSSIFRLPVDRVFTMRGFGTVITGSLMSGQIAVGDNVMLYPSMVTSRVRGIQAHGQSVGEAHAGMRTAINFQGLEKTAVSRGEVISAPGVLMPSYMVDVSLHYLAGNKKRLKNRTRVRFHTGTSEVLGNLILLEKDDLSPGDSAVAQLRLDAPVALVKDDHFVIRSYSPVRTIGGGTVLHPAPRKHRRFRPEVIESLGNLQQTDPAAVVSSQVKNADIQGVTLMKLGALTNLPAKQLTAVVQDLMSRQEVLQVDKEHHLLIHQFHFASLGRDLQRYLKRYHAENPLKTGMPKEELKSKFPPNVGVKLFVLLLNQLRKDGVVVLEGESLRLAGHEVSLKKDQADIKKRMLGIYQKAGIQPPYFKEVAKTLGLDPGRARDVLSLLIDEQRIVKTKDDLYFDRQAFDDLKQRLVDYLVEKGEITTPQFKEMTGASRKYVIPLLEHFDSTNVTIRIGDSRKIRQRN